jgi:hypothetical protein
VAVVGERGFTLNAYYAGKYGETTRETRFGLSAIIPF